MAASVDDPAITIATAIARAAKAALVVVDIGEKAIDKAGLHALAATSGLPVRHIVADHARRSGRARHRRSAYR